MFFYAVLITLAVVFATMVVGRAAERAKKLEAERDNGLLGPRPLQGLAGGGRRLTPHLQGRHRASPPPAPLLADPLGLVL